MCHTCQLYYAFGFYMLWYVWILCTVFLYLFLQGGLMKLLNLQRLQRSWKLEQSHRRKPTAARDDYQQAKLTLPFPGHYYKSESFCITVDWEFHTSKYFLTHKSSTIQCHKKIFNVCNYSPWKDITITKQWKLQYICLMVHRKRIHPKMKVKSIWVLKSCHAG